MIVDCPNCGKQMSSKAKLCSSCGFTRDGVSEDQLIEFRRRKLRDRIYHLKMLNYAAITVFLAAFGWYWYDTGGFQEMSARGPVVAMALGAIAYLAVRVLLFNNKRKLKKLR